MASKQRQREKGGGHRVYRRGRIAALQMLYALDRKGFADDGLLSTDDLQEGAGARAFARELVQGYLARREGIDGMVEARLDNWTLERMAVVDRSLLRLGCYELIYRDQTPPKVAINEYIELGKTFGSEPATPKLVNGVLDRIAKEHLGDDAWQ